MISYSVCPNGVSVSLSSVNEPTIRPASLSSHPARFRLYIIRSILYRYSPTSSSTSIFPLVFTCEGEPEILASRERLPPVSLPVTLPSRFMACGSQAYWLRLPSSASRRLSTYMFSRVATVIPLHIREWMLAILCRSCTCACSAVISLYPQIHLGCLRKRE